MRKFSLFLCVFGILATSVSANSSYENQFTTVQPSTSFGLQAKSYDSYVQLQWNPVANSNPKGFVYYKIVRSQSNTSPAYPEDGYIQYSSDTSFSSYKDESPVIGKAYYRVCAIYEGLTTSGQKSRFCSNVVTIVRDKTIIPEENRVKQDPKSPSYETKKTEPSTGGSSLTQAIKKRLDTLLTNFQKNLDKRDIVNAEKSAIIDKAITRYTNLATETKSPATKKMAYYMVEKLNLMKVQYVEEDTSEIEDLLLGL